MTDEEIKERANAYLELVNYKPFQRLVAEMEEDIKEIKEVVINYLTDGLQDKAVGEAAIIPGMRRVISTPINAIKESNNLNENS